MADIHLAQRDWTKLRGSKLFVCPQIADAYYHEQVTKSELEDVGRRSDNPKLRVTSRVSSDVCDLVPVKHEKAEAALAAFKTIVTSRGLEVAAHSLTGEAIIGSLLRPQRLYAFDSANLFGAVSMDGPQLEALTGLASKTLKNVRKKGRLNAHTAAAVARTALTAYLYENMPKESLGKFGEMSLLKKVLEGKQASIDGLDLSINRKSRHDLFDRFLTYCRKCDLGGVEDPRGALKLARRNLRDFFTTDYQAFSTVIMKATDDSYLVDAADQVAATSDWRTWS